MKACLCMQLTLLLVCCWSCRCCCCSVMLMFITTTWAEDATIAAVIAYACFYGGFGQMVAGVFEVCAQQQRYSSALLVKQDCSARVEQLS